MKEPESERPNIMVSWCVGQAILIKRLLSPITPQNSEVIRLYFNDHNPPHFHFEYNEYSASVLIETLGALEGCGVTQASVCYGSSTASTSDILPFQTSPKLQKQCSLHNC